MGYLNYYDAIHVQHTDNSSAFSKNIKIILAFNEDGTNASYYTIPIRDWCGIQFRIVGNTSLKIRIFWGANGWGEWHTIF